MNKLIFSMVLVFGVLSAPADAKTNNVLMIGDKAPDIEAFEWIKGKPFDGYQEGRVYLVEFGATWCVGCKAAIPHLTELSKKYSDVLSVYGFFIRENNMSPDTVYTEHVDRVKEYVDGMGGQMAYNVGVDGPEGTLYQAWGEAVNWSGVPHAFIVDKAGRVAWVGSPISNRQEMDTVLAQVINNQYDLKSASEAYRKAYWQKVKSTVDFDGSKPLLVNGNGGDDTDFMFRSLLSKWRKGVRKKEGFGLDFIRDQSRLKGEKYDHLRDRIQLIGYPLSAMYFMAYNDRLPLSPFDPAEPVTSYGKLWPEVILEVNDPAPFADWRDEYKNGEYKELSEGFYNYSLIVPKEKANNRFLQSVMRSDLKSWFGYNVMIEERGMPVWYLKSGKDAARLLKRGPKDGYKGLYGKFHVTPDRLAAVVHGRRQDMVVLDDTDIEYGTDMSVMERLGQLPSGGTLDDFNSALKSYGLYLEEGTHKMRVIVIRDPNSLQ